MDVDPKKDQGRGITRLEEACRSASSREAWMTRASRKYTGSTAKYGGE